MSADPLVHVHCLYLVWYKVYIIVYGHGFKMVSRKCDK